MLTGFFIKLADLKNARELSSLEGRYGDEMQENDKKKNWLLYNKKIVANK